MADRLRGRAGQEQRQRRLMRTSGLCEMCLELRRVELATDVDHIRPLALGGDDVDANTRNLCRAHHLLVTAAQFGRAAPIAQRGADVTGMPTDPHHPWNHPSR